MRVRFAQQCNRFIILQLELARLFCANEREIHHGRKNTGGRCDDGGGQVGVDCGVRIVLEDGLHGFGVSCISCGHFAASG